MGLGQGGVGNCQEQGPGRPLHGPSAGTGQREEARRLPWGSCFVWPSLGSGLELQRRARHPLLALRSPSPSRLRPAHPPSGSRPQASFAVERTRDTDEPGKPKWWHLRGGRAPTLCEGTVLLYLCQNKAPGPAKAVPSDAAQGSLYVQSLCFRTRREGAQYTWEPSWWGFKDTELRAADTSCSQA